ncbi:hypothetical protein ASPWEDRAFT_169807 [Aspergillus wentii DTO 134E9]|uniref:Mechanosensitive ion channel protein n=1 Tax=Aspergillus wentii DTO 134E9 TaxID=1073089 RepID=A0A1L9RN75_ASPWE|nr:uncharacterized protein ASPWEDRAFT_169807 [Aspergillus wentii DTO 134E9]KAI9923435.1 hypothetical protein MW887_009316 [Aspergillus wentii]OJJ36278.1 hypothetical protein ASPWEDRAFT_169807 [Aspergillus wentii DTO 134E9]
MSSTAETTDKHQNAKQSNEPFPVTDNDISSNDPKEELKGETRYDDDDDRGSTREMAKRLEDDLAVLEAERVVSRSTHDGQSRQGESLAASRSHRSRADEFDEATNPLHEVAAVYNPPETPNTTIAAFIKKLHESSFIVRYLTYIVPVVLLLLIPLLVGALAYPDASVGGVSLLWFSVWLQIVWLTIWAGRVVAKCVPVPVGILASIFTNDAKKWRNVAKQLQIPMTLFFWWLGVEISFLPTMKNHHLDGDKQTQGWEMTLNKIIITIFVWTILNLIEKLIIQLIAISFHTRTYADRIEVNKFQIGSLAKLYAYSRIKLADKGDDEFAEQQGATSTGKSTPLTKPLQYAGKAQKVAKGALNRVSDLAGTIAADFTGNKAVKRNDPQQVVITLLRTVSGSQTLARRLYRTYVHEDTLNPGDLKDAFDSIDEAEAAFGMFDKDLNGDIAMDELEAVCVEIGRERKAITASLKDLDSVVGRLDNVLEALVVIITIIVFLSLISTSAAGVLTSAGSTILALSWLFSTTAVEFLQSVVFVFIKHPFDVGDRVTIYGNAGASGRGDDYFVKEISLLYTEFKKMEGHVVQAPNSVLNSIFILNQRRSGALAEAVPITIKYGTSINQVESLRQRLMEFVTSERREFQSTVLTEMREVTENFSITLNIVFFYKSNWQNEGLRLQRRNKFICMLMTALQEIGIHGPRMNWPGARADIPFHLAGLSHLSPSHQSDRPNTSNSSGPSPPILRKGMDTAAAQARGDRPSVSRHVDFSLGMQAVSSADVMGDVFEERSSRTADLLRTVTRVSSQEQGRRSRSIHSTQSKLSLASNQSARHRSTHNLSEPDVERANGTELTTAPTVPDPHRH